MLAIIRSDKIKFHGKAGEYFAIWIVNLLLTIVSIGIYSVWAKIRTNRYFYSNTEVDGHRFSYLAGVVALLVQSMRFNMNRTGYRNIPLGFLDSYGSALLVFIVYPILSVFTSYLAMPLVLKKNDQYIVENMTFGAMGIAILLVTAFVVTGILSIDAMVSPEQGGAMTIVAFVAINVLCSSF